MAEPITPDAMSDFLKLSSTDDVADLSVDDSAPSTAILHCAHLPPFLTDELLDMEKHDVDSVMVAFAKAIKQLDDNIPPDDEDTPRPSASCEKIMQFLWAVRNDKIKSNPLALCNNDKKCVAWYKEQRRTLLKDLGADDDGQVDTKQQH